MPSPLSSAQFVATRTSPLLDQEPDALSNQTGSSNPQYQGDNSVLPLKADTFSTPDRTAAWQLPRASRGGNHLRVPHPYTKRTAGSTFSFSD